MSTTTKGEAAGTVGNARRLQERVLVLAPFGCDASVVCQVLSRAGFDTESCGGADELCREINRGAGAALLAEEALSREARNQITVTLTDQPVWSDFPLLLLISHGKDDRDGWRVLRDIKGTAHLALLERPLHAATLVSAVRAALEARRRQYQVRDELAARQWAEEALRQLNESLEQQVTERVQTLSILQDVAIASNEARTVEEAMLATLKRICDYNRWLLGHAYRLADDGSGCMLSSGVWYVNGSLAGDSKRLERLKEFQRLSAKVSFAPGEGLIGRVLQSGEPCWLDEASNFNDWRRSDPAQFGLGAAIAFPVKINDTVVAILECFSDKPIEREPRFMEIMFNVGIQLGHLIERKQLEREVAETAEREQHRIGRDIHDGLGQELTGLRYLAETHAESLLKQSSPDAKIVQRIAEGFGTVQKQLRAVIRDLVPVEVDTDGLVFALRSLAERTAETHHIACTFECDKPIPIENNLLATHLYRIVQEAVNNAVRHAEADQITIRLKEEGDELKLQVVDDGVGMDIGPHQNKGYGLRTMAFRAGLAGARLDVRPGQQGGTIVDCTVPR